MVVYIYPSSGTIEKAFKITSPDPGFYVNHLHEGLGMDQFEDLYLTVEWVGSQFDMLKIGAATQTIEWQVSLDNQYRNAWASSGCIPDDDDKYFYVGGESSHNATY